MVDKLIKFAKTHYEIYRDMPDSILRHIFETYKSTTIVYQVKGQIRGFAIYQDWPDRLHFILICGAGDNPIENVAVMLEGAQKLPDKMISFFDEEKMELKTICRRSEQQ